MGSAPQIAIAVDINGDGRLDLVTANDTGANLTVLTNMGGGRFISVSSPGVGANPRSLVAADVNGDGLIDLISANYGSGNLSILTNNGSGGFVLSSSPTVALNPLCVVAADVNGDGKIDLISANSGIGADSISVLTNNGGGGFALAGTNSVGNNPWSLAAGDFNGDGRPDLVVANQGVNSLSVLINNGSGGFTPFGLYPVGASPRSVCVADVNGDGRLDLISANYNDNTLSIYTNNGSGGFALAGTNSVGLNPIFVATADVNGDGSPDLACANYNAGTVTILTNNGSGRFFPAQTNSVGLNPSGISFADVDGDGKVDLIVANHGVNTVMIFKNATPFPPATRPFIITQPAGRTNLIGSMAIFSVSVAATNGVQLFSYQWRLSGTNLPAATNNTLALPNLSVDQAGTYTVVVTNSAGSVTSAPAILDVRPILVYVNGQPADGTVSAALSATVTLASGYPNGFLFYTLDGSTPDSNSTFYTGPFNLSNSAVVRAVALSSDFTQQSYSAPVTVQVYAPLNVTTPGGGSLTANGYPFTPATNFLTGSTVTLNATPASGWSFLGWQGAVNTNSNPLSIVFNQTNSLQAVFGTVVTTNILGGGAIVLSRTNPVPYGTILTASALPNATNYLASWGGAAAGTNSPTLVTVTNANPIISALFLPLPYGKLTLSVIVSGTGFVTNNPQRSYYNPGDVVTLKAVNLPGAVFLGWSQDVVSITNSITVTLNTNKIIVATFGAGPVVVISPTNLTVNAGSNATFTATANGLPTFTYQWVGGAGPVSGATNAIFTITNSQPVNTGNYFVLVSNSFGSVTSAVATLTVIGMPVITNQPAASLSVVIGHAASFNVGAAGSPVLMYQWRFNGVKVAGATNSTYTLSNAFPVNAGTYTVVVTNVYGSVTSNPSLLTVLPLNITSPKKLSNGQFQFTFDSANGVSYAVQYSTNLLTAWMPLFTVEGNGSPLTLVDPNTAGTLMRFYRLSLTSP